MAMTAGSCRFGLWYVHVHWSDTCVHRLRFATTAIDGPVPPPIRKYCAGQPVPLTGFSSIASATMGEVYAGIYRAVREIPYGEMATYGEIARQAGTGPRVVGRAMANNPTPLVIPCHRVIGARGIGGFSSSIEIKEALLAMEKREVTRLKAASRNRSPPGSAGKEYPRGIRQ